MGLLYNAFSFNTLKEAEIDGENAGDTTQTPDYTNDTTPPEDNADTQDTNNDTTESPEDNADDNQNTDDQPQDNDDNQDPDDDYEPTDYTDDNGASEPDDDNDDSSSSGDTSDEEEAAVDDIKKQEEDLLSNFTPEQLDIKHKELKEQFLSMFDMINSYIERIGDVAVNVENISTIEYISNKLSELKDMLTDYMKSVYKTKSYTENSINYNRFLATLNGINKILEEIIKKED